MSTAEDFRRVMICINQEVNNLAHHTGAHFVRFMLCSNIHDTFQPALVTDLSASMKFFERVVGVPVEDILVKFKQFFCAKSLMGLNEPNKIKKHMKELAQCKAAGEVVKKKRKQRSDARSTKPQRSRVESSGGSSDSGSSDNKVACPSK
ncbi:hypothetical protein EDD18DRAFT_1106930 [Armillaria luteobubalina]|uniref:Uncharacterized protein n=1 Tax=Armillaria luteobubalina TaxID=153913 RepID=A0AA39Q3H8_9AGAR|nr:hypothetical protein EDD18DRAFT_1106930 [Armillaria luteobubalina]